MAMVKSSACELNTVSQMLPKTRSVPGGWGKIMPSGGRSRTSAPWANSRETAGTRETVVVPAGQRPPDGGAWESLLKPLLRGGRIVRDLPPPRTIRDFVQFCKAHGITIERAIAIDRAARAAPIKSYGGANLFGEQGLFLLSRRPADSPS